MDSVSSLDGHRCTLAQVGFRKVDGTATVVSAESSKWSKWCNTTGQDGSNPFIDAEGRQCTAPRGACILVPPPAILATQSD